MPTQKTVFIAIPNQHMRWLFIILTIIGCLLSGLTVSVVNAFSPDQIIAESSHPVSVINPSIENNAVGSAFPGFRASNQLIVYNKDFPQSRTGTNEYGYEVTVINNRVVKNEGADSIIPKSNGYVLSGHGKARDWLIKHVPLGATITINSDNNLVTSIITVDTYRYQVANRLDAVKDAIDPVEYHHYKNNILSLTALSNENVIQAANKLKSNINKSAWKKTNIFGGNVIRGVWHRPVETTQKAIEAKLDQLKVAGINTVFLEGFYHGYLISPSDTYITYGITENQNSIFMGTDPIQVWTQAAHSRGMKLHIWFQSFYVGTDYNNGPGPILKKHPEWANIQYISKDKAEPAPSNLEPGAYFADPANPEAKTFLLALIQEILDKYDVDGIQLDYMDYPMGFPPDRTKFIETSWGYSPIARQEFKALTGTDPINLTVEDKELLNEWAFYKENKVNEFVKEAYTLIKNNKPHVLVSATAFPKLIESKVRKHEDWKQWAKEGWIDFLAPMLLSSSPKVVKEDTEFVIQHSGKTVPVISGVFGPFVGSNDEVLADQLLAADAAGAEGFSIFDTAHLNEAHFHALNLLLIQSNQ